MNEALSFQLSALSGLALSRPAGRESGVSTFVFDAFPLIRIPAFSPLGRRGARGWTATARWVARTPGRRCPALWGPRLVRLVHGLATASIEDYF